MHLFMFHISMTLRYFFPSTFSSLDQRYFFPSMFSSLDQSSMMIMKSILIVLDPKLFRKILV